MWSTLRALPRRLRAMLQRNRLDEDTSRECDAHLDLLTARNVRAGMAPEAAREAAVRQFGNAALLREDIHLMNSFGWLESLLQDVRYALRGMRRSPAFTAVAVMTLALGLGANTTVFTVTNAVLFKGFRLVDRNDRILYIGTQNHGRGCCVSYPDFVDWQAQASSFEGMGAVADLQIVASDADNAAEHYDATQITTNAFHLLGQRPLLGRDFLASDAAPGAPPVAILRYGFWQRRYGKDPAVIGRTLRVNGEPTTIVGVMPDGFAFPQNEDLWLPLVPTPALDRREARGLWFAFGRLAPGVTFDGARAELQMIGRRLAASYPRTNADWVPEPRTFAEFFVGRNAPLIYGAMWGAVGFVLLIACANLANLMLSRAIGRSRETSVRIALGAGRGRIVRQVVVESLLLSTMGGGVGWWIARWGVRTYELTANPPTLTWSDHLLDYSMDGRVFAYLLAVSVAAALLFGLAPALSLSTLDVHGTLKDGGRAVAGRGSGGPLSRLLVIGEIALAVILLAGAGAMVRSFLNMATADLGVRTASVTTMFLHLPPERFRTADSETSFFDRLTGRLASNPDIESLSITTALPASGSKQLAYETAGAPPIDEERRPAAPELVVGPGYFGTLGVPMLSGRDFDEFDGPSGAGVAIVNQQFATTQWPGEDAVGKQLRLYNGATAGPWLRVVGVAANVVQNGDRQARDPIVYRPYRQQPEQSMWVVVHARARSDSLASSLRRAVHAVDADLPIWLGPFTLDERLAGMGNYWSIGNDAALFAVFAAIALLLASMGLYAVVAQSVSQRTQEIGVRIAIGATSGDVLTLVMRQGMQPLAIGLAIGLAASFAVTPILQSQLVRVSPVDPLTLIGVSAVLIVSAALGCLIPSLRAARVDPVVALRHD